MSDRALCLIPALSVSSARFPLSSFDFLTVDHQTFVPRPGDAGAEGIVPPPVHFSQEPKPVP